MKVVMIHNDGSPNSLRYDEVDRPVPADDQVLIQVRAASVNPLDAFPLLVARITRPLILARLRRPQITPLGRDVAGVVAAVGRSVTRFKPGDAVFGACNGAFAEYACAREKNLVLKPANLSFEAAAAVPVAAITALQGLREHGGLQPGQRVLIEGASGGVGFFAIQIAKALGAEVTAVCSPKNMDQARALGADHVIDYTHTDFTRAGRRYDLIAAANGHHVIFAYPRALKPQGVFVLMGGAIPLIFQAMAFGPLLARIGSMRVRFFIAEFNQVDLERLKDLLETAQIAPVIDRQYPFSEIPEALRYRNTGHARGKVVITLGASPEAG